MRLVAMDLDYSETPDLEDVYLTAISEDLSVYKDYKITCERDLFKKIHIHCAWGRISSKARTLNKIFDSHDEARKYYKAVLNRRKISSKKTGTRYKIAQPSEV